MNVNEANSNLATETNISGKAIHTILVMVKAFARGAMGCRIDPSWGGPIELFLVPASDPQLV